MIFIIIASFLIFLSFFYDYRGVRQGKLMWWIFMMLLMIFAAGFRYKMGTDSIMYEAHYEWEHSLSQLRWSDFKTTRYAPLYVLLTAICRSVTSEFMIVQFVVAIIVNTVFFRFIWRHCTHVFFAALLYFFFLYFMLNMQVLREAIGASIFLTSWPYFKEKRWIKYYICCVLAFLFHISAIALFLLPLCLLPGIRSLFVFGRRTLWICMIIFVISFAVKFFLFDFVHAIALTEAMADRARTYSNHELGGSTMNLAGMTSWIFKFVFYPCVALYFLKKSRSIRTISDVKKDKNELFEFMTLLAVYVALLSVGVMIFERYNHYFEIFALITIADWFYSPLKNGRSLVRLNFVYSWIIILPLFLIQFYTVYYANYNKSGSLKLYDMYYPYSNQFEKELSPKKKKVLDYTYKHG